MNDNKINVKGNLCQTITCLRYSIKQSLILLNELQEIDNAHYKELEKNIEELKTQYKQTLNLLNFNKILGKVSE